MPFDHRASAPYPHFSPIGTRTPPPALTVKAVFFTVMSPWNGDLATAPYCSKPTPPSTYGVTLPIDGRSYTRLMLDVRPVTSASRKAVSSSMPSFGATYQRTDA